MRCFRDKYATRVLCNARFKIRLLFLKNLSHGCSAIDDHITGLNERAALLGKDIERKDEELRETRP